MAGSADDVAAACAFLCSADAGYITGQVFNAKRRLVAVTDDAPAPRLAPLPRTCWNEDAIDALRSAFPSNVVDRFLSTEPDAPPVPSAIATMLHHPALAGPWLAYNNVLLWSPALDDRLREQQVLDRYEKER